MSNIPQLREKKMPEGEEKKKKEKTVMGLSRAV